MPAVVGWSNKEVQVPPLGRVWLKSVVGHLVPLFLKGWLSTLHLCVPSAEVHATVGLKKCKSQKGLKQSTTEHGSEGENMI